MCEAADAPVVNTSAVCTSALACAGAMSNASSAVFERTPYAMPSVPSTNCAAKPIASSRRNSAITANHSILYRDQIFITNALLGCCCTTPGPDWVLPSFRGAKTLAALDYSICAGVLGSATRCVHTDLLDDLIGACKQGWKGKSECLAVFEVPSR